VSAALGERVEVALERARGFLVASQRPSGELPVEYTTHEEPGRPREVHRDSSPFITAFATVGLCADRSAGAREVCARAVTFIESQREWPGLWRFWGPGSRITADLDSTSVCRTLLEQHGRTQRSILWLYRRNVDRAGRFRTWLTPGNVRTLHPLYWLLMLRELRPFRCYHLFRRTAAHRRDRDVVVNANVVTLLGDVPATRGAIDWIVETVRDGEEERRDKWYLHREALYLVMGRAHARGVRRFGAVAALIVERIAERRSAQGDVAGDPLRSAMAVSALVLLGQREEASCTVAWLTEVQDDDGGWASAPLHYGGPTGRSSWGSRAVTTALVVEALALFEASHA
jgi:hypothetical protein